MELLSATTCHPGPRFGEMLMRCVASQGRTRADSQVQDRDSHRIHAWRLFLTLTDIECAGQQDAQLVSGSRIFPDTEEATHHPIHELQSPKGQGLVLEVVRVRS
jgi:hypothetical protein